MKTLLKTAALIVAGTTLIVLGLASCGGGPVWAICGLLSACTGLSLIRDAAELDAAD